MSRRWQIRHESGTEYWAPPEFATRAEAEHWRDKWNKDDPGHTVVMIERDLRPEMHRARIGADTPLTLAQAEAREAMAITEDDGA